MRLACAGAVLLLAGCGKHWATAEDLGITARPGIRVTMPNRARDEFVTVSIDERVVAPLEHVDLAKRPDVASVTLVGHGPVLTAVSGRVWFNTARGLVVVWIEDARFEDGAAGVTIARASTPEVRIDSP